MIILRALLILTVLFLNACASIYNSNAQPIQLVGSEGKVALIEVIEPSNKVKKMTLPAVNFSKPSSFNDLRIRIIDPCYEMKTHRIEKMINRNYWLNFLNLHGFYIDYFTGYMWSYINFYEVPLVDKLSESKNCIRKQASKMQIHALSSHIKQNNKTTQNLITLGLAINRPENSRQRYANSATLVGFYAAYTRRLSRNLMINMRYQNIDSGESLGRCSVISDTCSLSSVNHKSISVSFRSYLSVQSRFYAGFGASRINLNQDINDFSSIPNKSFSIETNTYGSFIELGWIERYGKISFHLGTMIDLIDFRLTTSNFGRGINKLDEISNVSIRNSAKNDLYSAARLTNISFGVSTLF